QGVQLCGVERQRAYELAGRGEDRVADRWHGRRYPGLAGAGRRRVAVDEVDAGIRRDVGPRDLVRIEIALYDTAVFRADIAVKNIADRHDRGASHVGSHPVRLDRTASIDTQ